MEYQPELDDHWIQVLSWSRIIMDWFADTKPSQAPSAQDNPQVELLIALALHRVGARAAIPGPDLGDISLVHAAMTLQHGAKELIEDPPDPSRLIGSPRQRDDVKQFCADVRSPGIPDRITQTAYFAVLDFTTHHASNLEDSPTLATAQRRMREADA